MSSKSEPNLEKLERVSPRDAPGRRQNLVRILFVHRSISGSEQEFVETQ